MGKKSAIMSLMPMSEVEFWKEVKGELKKGNHPMLVAIELVRDEHGMDQNHIASLYTRIDFTCYRLRGYLISNLKTLVKCRKLIDDHIKQLG